MNDGIKIKGMFRLQIEDPSGDIVGDSGWHENQVVNLGFNHYLVSTLGAIAGSKQITHVSLGEGSQPGAADTALQSECSGTGGNPIRSSVTAATSSTSKTLNLTATFASSDSFVTATENISNIGLFNTSAAGSLFAGNTYASSSCATNQNVNVTYNITFA